ncbi:peptide ABC transporter substrate-binding protein [Carnobacterium sp.]|uniref:peptide ABC transporter substrate-binding protein n=1 Tax=Carnobacterium sp. TaxID=48221 RepID=UPI0028A8278A|nr:peptide ABC transporter substrate-binding protein [Carnobacterium sp.]
MKKSLFLLLAASFTFAGCSVSNNESKASTDSSSVVEGASYNYVYATDIATLDYVFSSRTTNSVHYTNFVDGLLENDSLGNLIPALAESWEVSEDGLTYTYKIRKGVKWVTNAGTEYAEVTANDFVTGLKHAADVNSETLYIVADSVKGLGDYVDGKITDFNEVGVKAVDDYTVEYTLNEPESYWNSKTTYGILYPINEEFLNSQGENFGSVSPDSILYNGAFILTNNTAKSVIEYEKNELYWDIDNVFIDDVKYTFNDGSDPDGLFTSYQEGNFSLARVYPNSAGYAAVKKAYPDGVTFSQTDGTTYNMTFNLARASYNATSKTTDKEKDSTKAAVLNRDFRLAVQFAFDRAAYNAQSVGEETSTEALRNTLVPPTFVQIDGKDYGEAVESELEALDSATWSGVDLADGHDEYFDKDKAMEHLEKAKEALAAEKVSFPIHLDIPILETSEIGVNSAKSLKNSIESTLGSDNVVVDIQLLNDDAYLAATYQATTGTASDFDISTASGWGPDYQDPSTYLNIYNSRTGDMLTTFGLDGSDLVEGEDVTADAKAAVNFEEYDALLDAASAIKDDEDARYKAYAKAEAWLLNNALQIPIYAGGGLPRVTNVVPFTAPYSWSGIAADKLKYVQLQEDIVTTDQYQKAQDKWDKERAQ